ncbi:MAG TPA: hypothetical protein VNV17_23520 [Solirubrobacteraceae bacterium]|jgi:hypothetical protein|nr:hypothetical protein [Solirubrobacteraceae bacterium]
MDTITPDRSEESWDAYQDAPETEAPVRRRARRQFFNRRTAALGALITCAIGFYAGIRVEKGQLSSSGSTLGATAGGGGARAALAARFARGGSAGASGAAGASGGAAAGGAAAGGFAGRLGGGAAGASFGTVASVKGKTIYVTDTSGNTVKVKVTPSTTITKNQSVSRHAIRPGDTIIVTGGSGSGGATTAATITDSGNRGGSGSSSGGGSGSGSGSSGSGSGSSSGGGSNSAVGSLFSSGG